MTTWYKPGAYNVICDRTGFKVKSTEVRKEWTGRTVRNASFEMRHPQDFLRAKADKQTVPDPNPEGEDVFVGTNQVTPESL